MPGTPNVRIRGLIQFPNVTEVNVRPNASTAQPPLFKVPVGMSGQLILEVQPDLENKAQDGKIYQWFKLQFDGGAVGWVRDDLIELQGDATAFGYPDLGTLTWVFSLTRGGSVAPAPATPAPATTAPATTAPATTAPATTAPVTTTTSTTSTTTTTTSTTTTTTTPQQLAPVVTVTAPTTVPIQRAVLASGGFPEASADLARLQKLSYAISASFEGGYGAYNNYDAGIVSYGFLQFTLAAGSLATVLQRYTAASQTPTANSLRGYVDRVINRDATLRTDTNFRDLLRAAANEQEMKDAQNWVATNGFWQSVIDGYVTPRGLKYPLSWALLFDMGVNFGVNQGFVRLAEKDLNVQPPRSIEGTQKITEEQLMTYVAQLRKRSHDTQAARDNLPGLRKRGDFWMGLVTSGDWYLRGDASGNLYPNARTINALNP